MSSGNNLVVYTAILGRKDKYIEPRPGDYSIVLFTDREIETFHTRVVRVPPSEDPRRTSRTFKMLSHVHFPEAEYTLWLDGSIQVDPGIDLRKFTEQHLAQANLAAFRHPFRNCPYQEALKCIELKTDDKTVIRYQMDRYRKHGLPANAGLAEGGVLLRRNQALDVRYFNEVWFAEFESGSRRDQLSLNYSIWRSGVRFAYIEDFIRRKEKPGPGGFFARDHAR